MPARNLIFIFLSFLLLSFFNVGLVYSQTYTTSGLSTDWNDPVAWVKTNPDGCAAQNPADVPPTGPVWFPNCPIRIVINHPIIRTGDTDIGSGFMASLTVNEGGEMNFLGNLTVNNSGGNFFNFQINDGGRFTVGGTLGIRAGATFNVVNTSNLEPKTVVQVNNLTFLNAGSGQSVNVGANTVFNVINQTRLEGGGALNIQGEFNTNTFNSNNSGGNQVNVSGDGIIRTTGNMQINGFPMALSDNANVLVGGDLNITNSGSSSLNLNGPNTNFTVLSRGSTIASGKNPTGAGCFQTPENGNTCFNLACLEVIIIPDPVSDEEFERIYVFRCSTNWTVPNNTDTEEIVDVAEILIVAGGGGGGRGTSAGGGGAGGLISSDNSLTPGAVIPVIVGVGGAGSTNPNTRGQNGANSSFFGLTAIGGGGGGSSANNVNAIQRSGADGGSGGGSGNFNNNESVNGGAATSTNPPLITSPNGTTVFGNSGAGSNANGNNRRGGGGGGAGGNGSQGTGTGGGIQAGNGGLGRDFDITGTSLFYAGGGGGLAGSANGSGGSSIGGIGNGPGTSRNGVPNTGSGGGATSTGAGGNGANGVVIVRQTFRILPVEYLYFDANFRRQERLVELKWATGKEWENSHFEVERSVNDVKNWISIGRVEGQGYSDGPVDYLFKDLQPPLVGGNIFYRLKQVDFDGTFAYSKVVSARVPAMEVTNGVWRAFPNPTDGETFKVSLIDRSQYDDEALHYRLVHPMIFTPPITVSSEEEMNAGIEELVRKMPKGVFVVEIQWGRKVEHIKVMKK